MSEQRPMNLNLVPFVSVDRMMRIVRGIGVERFLVELSAYVEEDFRRWELFDKTPRVAPRLRGQEGAVQPPTNW